MAVTVVVDHQEIVCSESHSKTGNEKRNAPCTIGHDIVGEDDRDESEENQHEDVTPAKIGEMGGIEETEDDTKDTDKKKFPLQVKK